MISLIEFQTWFLKFLAFTSLSIAQGSKDKILLSIMCDTWPNWLGLALSSAVIEVCGSCGFVGRRSYMAMKEKAKLCQNQL